MKYDDAALIEHISYFAKLANAKKTYKTGEGQSQC